MIRQVSSRMRLQKVIKPDSFFNKLISKLKLPPNTVQEMTKIWKTIEKKPELWQGKKPVGIAAIVYCAVKQTANKRTQAKFARLQVFQRSQLGRPLEILNSLWTHFGSYSIENVHLIWMTRMAYEQPKDE